MSVEAQVISTLVEEGIGGLRKIHQAGVTGEDFLIYNEEYQWVEDRAAQRKPISIRLFRREFSDFEWLPGSERLQDLLGELRQERAHTELVGLINALNENLTVDNAVEQAEQVRDTISEIVRSHSPTSDVPLVSGWKSHYEEQKVLRKLRDSGEPPGIPSGFAHIDHHWDGFVNGRMIVVLGRPGEGKSYLIAKAAANAVFNKYRTVLISPEMNKREHTCRIHTLLSAMPEVKKALGLKNSFRNRALMSGIGYNLKSYRNFMEYIDQEMGECILLTATHRRKKMTTSFIESKIEELAPDLLIIDPIYKLAASRLRNSRTEELMDISDGIQDLAESYNIPIICTNQSHRQNSAKGDAPHKDSSFGSDVPIQEADHVIGVKNISDEHRMVVRCSKSRFGADFRFEMDFYPNTGVFRETEPVTGNYYNGTDDADDAELREIIATATGGKSDE